MEKSQFELPFYPLSALHLALSIKTDHAQSYKLRSKLLIYFPTSYSFSAAIDHLSSTLT